MIELLILHELTDKVLTMYGISKEIHNHFSVLTTPSYGTIKPALVRLQKEGFIKSQKTMTTGGRPSIFYSITNKGNDELVELLLSPLQDNPVQFLTTARIRLACLTILNTVQQRELFKLLKQKCEVIILEAKSKNEINKSDFYKKMVFDNLICEYKNFILMLEGLERVGNN